jgi:hypothetical protein
MLNFLFLKKTRHFVQIGLFAASMLTASAYAVDVWEFSAQDVLPILTEFKSTAKLSAKMKIYLAIGIMAESCSRIACAALIRAGIG